MRLHRIFSTIFFLFSGVSAAFSEPDLNCDAYAAKAVFQNTFASNVGCGFTGGRWSNNYEGHKAWCLSAGVQMQNLTSEDNARSGALAECQKVQSLACKDYANNAVLRARKNVEYNCRFTDSAFDDNYDGHYKWCMSVNMNVAANVGYNRNLEIGQCFAQKKEGICNFYVTAIKPLFQRQNQACAGRDDFVIAAPSAQDKADCLANTKTDAAWVNAQVDAMNRRINTCESNVITYDNPGWRGVLLDHCTNHLGAFCREDGNWVPQKFCEWKGHRTFDLAATGGSDIAVYLDCVKTGNVSAADESTDCYCRGSCGTYTSITCSGVK